MVQASMNALASIHYHIGHIDAFTARSLLTTQCFLAGEEFRGFWLGSWFSTLTIIQSLIIKFSPIFIGESILKSWF